ncbi:L,D-transpeptidase family protein [Streptomyces sp. TRM66268-LWL]|uniref:L,D-transpeptidase family protein n=2 Tax=Streptomyces polyasparticus TaxID=2767826 RepID=A0ABR7SQ45_9ACTN|nr:L,D-transpeptidase family protein [Streptomyces polyasparticus]MBC9717484.1 L,D-transpeptidase family protein [Streptomyces polyasparticus]
MERMRFTGTRRSPGTLRSSLLAVALATALTSCGTDGGTQGSPGEPGTDSRPSASPTTDLAHLPGIGERLRDRIPSDSRQVIAVYGRGENSARSTVALFTKHGTTWDRERSWPAHNGKKGWTTDHREGDKRSPVGVFTLSDAGGVLADPGTKLRYTRSAAAFTAPRSWPKTHWHDFDLVIAIDYNRVKGTSPGDPTRPQGRAKGGSIWLHLDHGSGTSGCVSLPEQAMTYLLTTLDPAQKPVIVMGDEDRLKA